MKINGVNCALCPVWSYPRLEDLGMRMKPNCKKKKEEEEEEKELKE